MNMVISRKVQMTKNLKNGIISSGSLMMMLLLVSIPSLAQDPKKKWTDGEIENVEIEIVKEREITLPAADRNFEKIPPRPSEPIKPPITYDFKSFSFQAPQINPQIRPLKLKQENPSEVYRGIFTDRVREL